MTGDRQHSPSGFTPDGRALFYRSDAVLHRVSIDTARGFRAGKPEPLFYRVATGRIVSTYAPSPDGRRFFTFRSPGGESASRKAVALDLGFGSRLASGRP